MNPFPYVVDDVLIESHQIGHGVQNNQIFFGIENRLHANFQRMTNSIGDVTQGGLNLLRQI